MCIRDRPFGADRGKPEKAESGDQPGGGGTGTEARQDAESLFSQPKGGGTIPAVSYTHLDVYKRQQRGRGVYHGNPHPAGLILFPD